MKKLVWLFIILIIAAQLPDPNKKIENDNKYCYYKYDILTIQSDEIELFIKVIDENKNIISCNLSKSDFDFYTIVYQKDIKPMVIKKVSSHLFRKWEYTIYLPFNYKIEII